MSGEICYRAACFLRVSRARIQQGPSRGALALGRSKKRGKTPKYGGRSRGDTSLEFINPKVKRERRVWKGMNMGSSLGDEGDRLVPVHLRGGRDVLQNYNGTPLHE